MVISESQIAKAIKTSEADAIALLHQLDQLKIILYLPVSFKPQLTFITPRQDAARLPIDNQWLEARRQLVFSKMKAMIAYVTDDHQCRQWTMLDYFDEKNYGTCEVCDVCLAKKKKHNLAELKDYRDQIGYLLNRKPMSVDELETEVKPSDHEMMMDVVREMVDEGKIGYDEFWVLRVKEIKT
jgi:ATP-dependent DNA helicase RecQ